MQVSVDDLISIFRYTRVTYEDAFPETGGDELELILAQINPQQILTFQVHLRNFKLQNFNNVSHLLALSDDPFS